LYRTASAPQAVSNMVGLESYPLASLCVDCGHMITYLSELNSQQCPTQFHQFK